jgi:hypothetical protein
MTQSDDGSTYHLEFRVKYSALVAWLGDEAEIFTISLWPCDEVGVVLR